MGRITPLGLTNKKLQDISDLLAQANREQLERIKEDIEKRIERLK